MFISQYIYIYIYIYIKEVSSSFQRDLFSIIPVSYIISDQYNCVAVESVRRLVKWLYEKTKVECRGDC